MERRLSHLSDRTFDLVVLGGGVLGACVARDAALRGFSVALLERDDFGSGTSANSLKLVHGGLRQLQHLDLRGMRTSAMERSVWLRTAPHLVEPIPVVVPLTGGAPQALAFRAALAVNDFVSSGTNRGLSPERRIPSGRVLSRTECLERVPELEGTGVTAGALFHDAVMYSSERLVLEVVMGAAEAGALPANRVECVAPLEAGGRRVGILSRDLETGDEIPVQARVVVNATGPWAPALTERLLGRADDHAPALSLAWNLVLPRMGHDVAFALAGRTGTPTGPGGKRPRRLFLLPWRGRTLVGTGHAIFSNGPETLGEVGLDHPALQAFLAEINHAWPGRPISGGEVVATHVGLLPAHSSPSSGVDSGARGVGRVRLLGRHRVSVASDGGSPLLTATTVKFTQARRVAEEVVDKVDELLSAGGPRCRTAHTLLPGAPTEGVPALLDRARRELGDALAPDVIEHLIRTYGTEYREVVAWRTKEAAWNQRLSPEAPVILAQLIHAIHQEMARSVDDLLFRRCELGPRGLVEDGLREQAARVLSRFRVANGSSAG